MLMLHRQSSTTGGLSGALRTLAVYAVLGGLAPEARAQCPHATGNSPPTVCAEEDNINIPFTGNVSSFVVEATHPAYAVGVDSCLADFTNCPPPGGGYPFPPGVFVLFDDGITIVEAVREASWWRPNGMLASADQGTPFTDVHYVRVSLRHPVERDRRRCQPHGHSTVEPWVPDALPGWTAASPRLLHQLRPRPDASQQRHPHAEPGGRAGGLLRAR